MYTFTYMYFSYKNGSSVYIHLHWAPTPEFFVMLRLLLFLLVLLQDLSGFQDSCSLVSGQTPDIFVLSFRCIPHQDRFTLHLFCFKAKELHKSVGNVARLQFPRRCLNICQIKHFRLTRIDMCELCRELPWTVWTEKMLRISGWSLPCLPWTLSYRNPPVQFSPLLFWVANRTIQTTPFKPHGPLTLGKFGQWQAAVVMDVQPRAGKSICTRRPWRFSTCTNRPILKPGKHHEKNKKTLNFLK